jgi:hypothetical protein
MLSHNNRFHVLKKEPLAAVVALALVRCLAKKKEICIYIGARCLIKMRLTLVRMI